MRVTAIVAGAAIVLAACGKGNKDAATTGDAAGAATPPAAAPAGAVHEIQMVQDGATYKFVPASTTIKVGDQVVFKGVSGSAHNVVFWGDSLPPGAKDLLNAAIPNKTGDLTGEMIMDGNSATVSFAGLPAGSYKFYCLPHQAMGMKGEIIVTP